MRFVCPIKYAFDSTLGENCFHVQSASLFTEISQILSEKFNNIRSQIFDKYDHINFRNTFTEISQIRSQKFQKYIHRNFINMFTKISLICLQKFQKHINRNFINSFTEINAQLSIDVSVTCNFS